MRRGKRGQEGPYKSPSPLTTRGQFSSSSSSLSSEAGPSRSNFDRSSSLLVQNRGDAAIAMNFGDEPIYTPSSSDISEPVMAYSAKENQYIEIRAVFVGDLQENWISKSLVDRLDLEPSPDAEASQEWGHLGLKTVEFQGTVELQWTQKGCLKTKTTKCRVIGTKSCILYLKSSLFCPPAPIPRTSSIRTAPLQNRELKVLQKETSVPPTVLPVVGAFDGVEKVIEDNAEESISADQWMENLSSVHEYIEKRGKQFRKKPAVKIAVLDTGIDPEHPSIDGAVQTNRIAVAESFVNGDETIDDRFGHGTHVAKLLLDVAPDAELYVAKIANAEEIPSDHNISKAIRWAVDRNVDIITMSFGLGKDQTEIQEAISDAYRKNIIMFAAASNKGGNYEVTYPARYHEVICVFSTDGNGNGSRCNPTPMEHAGPNFATLGEGVNSAWPIFVSEDAAPERRMTGTSFATPIAAGVAACILEFAIMNDMSDGHYRLLRRPQGMQKIFALHLATERQKLHYIHPWKLFGKGRPKEDVLTLITDTLVR